MTATRNEGAAAIAPTSLVELAADLEVLGATALRISANLRGGLADLAGSEPHDGVKPKAASMTDALLDAEQVAALLRVDLRTLRRWRHEERAPKPLRGKGPLRWDRAAVERWIEERAP